MQIASRRPAFMLAGPRAAVVAVAAGALALGGGAACRRAERTRPAVAAGRDGGTALPRVAISGQVIDRRQKPVPAARVLLFPVVVSDAAVETATGPDGGFRAAGLLPGPYRLLVEAAGFALAEKASVTAPAEGVSVVLDGAGRSVVGRVERDGAPVADVQVQLAPDDGGPMRQTTTRAGGGFAFGGLGAARYALRAAGADAASPVVRAVEAREETGGAPVRLTLAPAHPISGRVIDDAGVGLGRVEVRAEAAADDPLPVVGHTDASGRFSLGPVGPGAYRVSAARPGYVLQRAPKLEIGRDRVPGPVDLELVRGARLAGRIRDGAGGAAAGARVRCSASALDDLTVQAGPLPLAAEAAALPSGAGRALGTTRLVIADREGRFSIEDLIPGRYRIEVVRAGAEPFQSDELVLAPGDRRELGVLQLRAGIVVEGRVVDESAGPIEGARVAVSSAGTAAAPPASAMTDGSGRFALTLPAGSWRLGASAPGRGAAVVPVELRAGTAVGPVELKLGRAEARLEGLVRDDGGRPLARARITVFPPEAAGSPVGSGTADVGGHFSIATLPAGDLRLEIRHPDYPTTTTITSGGQYALVTVPFPGGVAGEVRARNTGAVVGRARVEAVGPAGATASTELRKTSSFSLMRLVPGRWRLTVTAPGFRPAERELDVAAAAALGEPSLRDVRVELDPG